jgi:hypothetical protein
MKLKELMNGMQIGKVYSDPYHRAFATLSEEIDLTKIKKGDTFTIDMGQGKENVMVFGKISPKMSSTAFISLEREDGGAPYNITIGRLKSAIKKAGGVVKEDVEVDHEVSMAQNQLNSIIKSANELKKKIGENEKDIPAWIQDHITNAENYIRQASSNYHEYGNKEPEE